MRSLAVTVLSLGLLACSVAYSASGRAELALYPTAVELLPQELEIVRLLNEYRVGNGLSALHVSPQLSRAARKHAEAMAGRGEMAHILAGEGPGARARAEGFTRTVGENVAAGTPGTSGDFFDLWTGSAEHRANMLRAEWGEVGVGYARSEEQGEDYWVAVFGALP
jgi:uncharacterized protein YkwD